MIDDLTKRTALLITAVVCASTVVAWAIIQRTGENPAEANLAHNKTETSQQRESPVIIWNYSGYRDSPESLTTALSSGLINHVLISYMHRADADWRAKSSVVEAIEITKKSNAKLIWGRALWPLYKNEGIRPETLFDPNYYIKEIQILRSEAEQIGADCVALDTEPYAYSPMKAYKKKQIVLTETKLKQLGLVMKEVVEKTGKVDFIYPEGSGSKAMPYELLAELGRYRISERTYYANYNRIKKLNTPYEIFGAYVNTVPENPKYPKLPFFTVEQIFQDSWLWSDKKGLYIYPKENRALEVARALVSYSRSLPNASAAAEADGNSSKILGLTEQPKD